jgi:MOSC domain-containing protein YiiM
VHLNVEFVFYFCLSFFIPNSTISYKQQRCVYDGSSIMMKILSVNVGLPRDVLFRGEVITTGIFKEPVQGRVRLLKLNLDGDKQADLTVHGGPDKAIYAYPSEHYEYWRHQFPSTTLSYGMFGENLTTEGLMEDMVNIGDQFQIGNSAKVIATQPRMPCYKLGVKFGRMDIIKRFLASGRPGIYFKVLREGEIGAADEIQLISKEKNNVTVKDIVRLYVDDRKDIGTMQRAVRIEALPEGWKDHFRRQIE